VINVRDHEASRDLDMLGGDVQGEEEAANGGPLGGAYGSRGGKIG